MQERLQKFISDSGVMSRRAAEREITAGRVTVNGVPAVIGQKVDPAKDHVAINGKPVQPRRAAVGYTYIMLNKPAGYVTTMSDDKGRRCVAELVEDVGCRVYPVGRLDYDSEGLLLLTDDGELTNRLTHPSHGIAKIYHVKIRGEITPGELAALRAPMTIDGYEIKPVSTEIVKRAEGFTTLRMELSEGRNRQIRKMCEQCELEVLKLRRIAVGELTLGDIRPGKWRHLTRSQVKYLKRACGMEDR